MDITSILTAKPRKDLGKGPVGRLRSEGFVPAVFYGGQQDPMPLTVNYKDLRKLMMSDTGLSIFKLQIDTGDGVDEKVVMLKDHDVDPIKRVVLHADFYEVAMDKPLQLEVPVRLEGEKPIGVERGGMLSQIRHTLLVSGLPANLPEEIVIDVTNLDMGESIHVEEIETAEGVEIVFDVNFTVATCIAPKGAKDEVEEGEEGEEGAEAEE